MNEKIIKLFLRLALAAGFLSAVTDRFGLWGKKFSSWGNWDAFLVYTQTINPLASKFLIPTIGIIATTAEIVFAICLIIGFKTKLFAQLSGLLLLIFALSMTFSIGVKSALDYAVFVASAAAFSLSLIKVKFLELDE